MDTKRVPVYAVVHTPGLLTLDHARTQGEETREVIDMTIHLPHPDLHRLSAAAQTAGAKIHDALGPHEHHECKRYEFLEDALLTREMGRL